jgi:hypothetical protein
MAKDLHVKSADAFSLSTLIKLMAGGKPDVSFRRVLEGATLGRNAVTLSHLYDESKRKGVLTESGEKVLMAIVLYLVGGFTESEQLLKEAKADEALTFFRPIDSTPQAVEKLMDKPAEKKNLTGGNP